ncbi:MAG: 50S ribosomal protein L21 [Firmicutes bacterium ADurb.Bin300]|nr:MAG: 50S ribosomal protein L21 [Firmicutes bacterium ADurb.Bin300]
MYAIIETGGKQYKVETEDVIFIEKLNAQEDSEITLDKVVALGANGDVIVGSPYVEGAFVKAKVLKNGKAKKIVVQTYKPKKNEKRKMGHRQPYTKVQITAIKAKKTK